MVMLQHASQHVVTFHFQFLRVNKEKRIHYLRNKATFVLDKCEITVDKKMIL